MMADRIFRADDGTELHEEDIRLLTCKAWTRHELDNDVPVAEERIRSALDGPQTCGATRVIRAVADDHAEFVFEDVCILPRGHHPYTLHPAEDGTRVVACNYPVGDGRACCKYADDPIHSPGHMTDQSTWSEA
jgi:hypothetical protein